MAALKKAEKQSTSEGQALSEAEYIRRCNLDVSDVEYINPSLEHYKKSE